MRSALIFLFAVLLAPVASTGQAAQNNDSAEKDRALTLVKIAADVADNVRHRPLNNYIGIFVALNNFGAAAKDGDLGPFFQMKDARAKPGRSAACVISPDKEIGLCVYFDGDSPYGVATAKAGVSGKIDPHRVELSYQGASKDLLKKTRQKLDFLPGDVATDDGQVLPAFSIRAKQENN
ncbi:MAG TPA: hypothetical protein VKW06_05910 [Candidatus Angelobacter sp.]|nr:hypothetical protein [Candidatus Angelobacter sp.]